MLDHSSKATGTVVLRSPTLADVDEVVAVINGASQALRGRDEIDSNGVEGWWTQPPPFDLTADVVVALRDEAIVVSGDVGEQANDGSVLWLGIRGDAYRGLHAELELDGEPAGVAICRPWAHGDPDCGWVSVLGMLPRVSAAGTRRGAPHARDHGAPATWPAPGRARGDAESTTGAVRLYERAGMRVVERWDIWERQA
jgi:hypothetical protein